MNISVLSSLYKRFSEKVNPYTQILIFNGNSFCLDVQSYNIAQFTRNTNFGQTFINYNNINGGNSGYTYRQLLGLDGQNGAEMDLYTTLSISGNACLVVVETSNTVFNAGKTISQTLEDLTKYCVSVRQYQPYIPIVICGTIPRYQTLGTEADYTYGNLLNANNALVEVDNIIQTSPYSYGADGFVLLRGNDGPYNFSNFDVIDGYLNSGGYIDSYIHPSISGGNYIGNKISAVLQSLN